MYASTSSSWRWSEKINVTLMFFPAATMSSIAPTPAVVAGIFGKFPVAARARFGHVRNSPDLVTSKLGALHAYQLSLAAPTPPKGSFDADAAARGQKIFDGKGRCSSCHAPPLYTEPGYNLHKPSETCSDPFIANRSPTGMYRTTPLRGMFAKSKRGFGADGAFPTLPAVVNHYDSSFKLGLTAQKISDLVQFLKSR
jgi:cytochrome c peroxidase